MSVALEHEAGPVVDKVQKCRWCGYVIDDFRNVGYLVDQGPPSHWKEGTKLVVEGVNPQQTYPSSAWTGEKPAPCLKQ